MFGPVASDPTVARQGRLAADSPKVSRAIASARAWVRAVAWEHAGGQAPDDDTDAADPLVIDRTRQG